MRWLLVYLGFGAVYTAIGLGWWAWKGQGLPRPFLQGWWAWFLFGAVGIPTWWMGHQIRLRRVRKRIAHGPTVLLLPRADLKPVDPAKVRLWERLGDVLPRGEWLSWELAGHRDAVVFALHASEAALDRILVQVRAEWPGTYRRAPETDPALAPEGWHVYWVEVVPTRWDRPIDPAGDAVKGVLLELAGLEGARGLVQVLARPDFATPRRLWQKAVCLRDAETQSKGVRSRRTQEAKALEKRAAQPFFQVTVRCVGLAPTEGQARSAALRLARTVISSFSGNPLRVVRKGRNARAAAARRMGRSGPWAASELAYLAHLVGRDAQALAPRLRTAPARSLPAPPEMRITRRVRTAAISLQEG